MTNSRHDNSTLLLHGAPPEPALAAGALVAGKYRVEQLLGEGGMGVVFSAMDETLERRVALKVIRGDLADNPSVVERLLLEARSAAKIQNEHIAKVLDVGTLAGGAPFIVMEHLEGQDLAAWLEQRGALPSEQAVDYVLQASEAVAEAHAHHIVHRDLKPENIFAAIRPDGGTTMKVLDFGISKQLGPTASKRLTQTSTSLGSPQYMAPEQMRAEPVDERADIWALGSILYELIANRPPFEGSTVPEVCAQVLGSEPVALSHWAPELPKALETAIHRCLAKAREDRFANVSSFAAAIAPFGSDASRRSHDRIRGVWKSSRQPTTLGAPPPLPFAETVRPDTTRDAALDKLLAGTAARPVSSTLGIRPRRPRWPWYGLGAGVVLAATVALSLQQETAAPAGEPGTAAEASPASPGAIQAAMLPSEKPEATEPGQQPTDKVENGAVSATTMDAGVPGKTATSPEAPPTSEATASAASKPPQTHAANRPSPKAPARAASTPARTAPTVAPEPQQGSSAWDPENYGNRN